MIIDENSYYLRYFNNVQRGESANLVHYKKVWNNGFSSDNYTIDKYAISFEDASWSGIYIDDSHAGTRLLKRKYEAWIRKIDEIRIRIEKLITAFDIPLNREIMVGDYIHIPFKKIFEEEDAAESNLLGNDCSEEENRYKGPNMWLLYITAINNNTIEGQLISIDKHSIYYCTYPKKLYDNNYFDRAIQIPKEVFEEVIDIIKTVSSTLLVEMKQKVRVIEEK